MKTLSSFSLSSSLYVTNLGFQIAPKTTPLNPKFLLFNLPNRTSMASTLNSHPNLLISSNFSHSPSTFPFSLKKPSQSLHLYTTFPRKMKYQQALAPLPSRRLFVASISGIWDALVGGNSARDAQLAVRKGMLLFRQGDVLGSVVEFDRAIELDPRQKAYLWQRGLSLYYLDRFEDGAEQFRIDVAQNPNDTEESIWCFLCEAQLHGVDEARRRFLEASQCLLGIAYFFLEVGRDSRPVMREAYNMFKDGGDPDKLVSAFLNGKEHEYFYASLYAGLYCESQKDAEAAKRHILAACKSPYGSRADDYMAALAKVHCLCRNWIPS